MKHETYSLYIAEYLKQYKTGCYQTEIKGPSKVIEVISNYHAACKAKNSYIKKKDEC